jgi:predicted phosphodiesterase
MSRRGLILLLVILSAIGLAVAVAVAVQQVDNEGASKTQRAEALRETPSAADSNRPATVWALGDAADGGDSAMQVGDLIARGRPDRVVYLGDVYDEGTADEFERNYRPAFGRFDKIASPTPGNHDWPNHNQGYDPYWGKANPSVPTNRHYYRFKAGGWEFISLNSESGLERGSPQMQWLKAQLKGKQGNCRIAFWHRPFLNAGRHGDQKDTGVLWRAVQGRAAIVLNGHDHNLQHFKPRDGIVELISGAGGNDHYSSNERDPRLAWDEDDQFGALRLDLRPGLARFRFVATDKGTIHRGRVRCHRS